VAPEKVTAYDVGYRGRIAKVDLDLNFYYNSYEGFISQEIVVTPNNGSTSDASGIQDLIAGEVTAFQTYTNSSADVSSYGANIGLNTKLFGFDLGASYTYAKLDFEQADDPDFSVGFNTPEHKVKLSFGHNNLFDNFGFNINARWQDEFLWQASIANAIVSERTVIDAQVNWRVPKIKSTFKIGGSNLGGDEYRSAVGAGGVGSQFYVSWVVNN
jgi:outer membrane receptor protein involved in Fe transport